MRLRDLRGPLLGREGPDSQDRRQEQAGLGQHPSGQQGHLTGGDRRSVTKAKAEQKALAKKAAAKEAADNKGER